MSEGELKKRMIAQWSAITDRKSIDFVLEPFYNILDEATKEFPILSKGLNSESVEEVRVWYEKWFGADP